MESFGVRLGRLVRDRRGVEDLSQDDLAARSGLTKARISDLETGKINNPQARTVDLICVALNISREDREACRVSTGPRLPPRLLENLALRFGFTNPEASEDELESFLKEKATEFRELQERLAQMNALDKRIATFIDAANVALEQGDFQLVDKQLEEAEQVQLTMSTLPALQIQHQLRSERAQAALLAGEVSRATHHWEMASNYFSNIDKNVEAEKRYEYCTRLREYGYRYRSVDALHAAEEALDRNLAIWERDRDLANWCKAMNALGAISWRLSQFDTRENFSSHVAKAKSRYEAVREQCSETIVPYYYAASGINLASLYSDRSVASSDEEYRSNLEKSLQLQHSALRLICKTDKPVDWGIAQHNLGCSYTQFAQSHADRQTSLKLANDAVHHLELSFEVRDPINMLQYWIASCRSLGEALIARSQYQEQSHILNDLQRAHEVLSAAASKMTEEEHPNQWAEVQEQLSEYSQRLRAIR